MTMVPDNSSDQSPAIQASVILAKIERGEDVKYDGVIVEGDLDISGLDLPTRNVNKTECEQQYGLQDEMKVIGSQINSPAPSSNPPAIKDLQLTGACGRETKKLKTAP